jgi:hypothetical protein
MLDVGCWMLDVGCWMLDVGCWMFAVLNEKLCLKLDSDKVMVFYFGNHKGF